MNKYKLTLHFIGHKLNEEDLKEAFEYVDNYCVTSCHEDYDDGYLEATAKLTQEGNDLKLEMIYHGEGETFREKAAEMKNAVETRRLQNSLLYETRTDYSSRIANKITATIEQIE